jgi:hypothetical protein
MKMKFFSFCVGAFLWTATSVNAQESSAQLRAGVNMANISVTDDGKVDDANMLTSFHVGVIGDIPLVGEVFSFQPGILFTGKGSKTQTGDASSLNYKKETFNPYYIEVPANFVFKAPMGATKFFVGAGPYLGVGVAGKTKLEGKIGGFAINGERDIEFSNDDPTTMNNEEGAGFAVVKRFDYGLNGTAGIEGKTVVLGVNYGLGLAKVPSGSNSSANNNNKHRVLSFSIGIKL